VQQGSLEDLVRHPANDFAAKFVRAQRPLEAMQAPADQS
jgi:ABC-type proline/glycine betaine transport system ATPase subunit